MSLEALFKSGTAIFEGSTATGAEWTFSAAGDYGILPDLGREISANGGENLVGNIRKLTDKITYIVLTHYIPMYSAS